jgi:hypothetical protein
MVDDQRETGICSGTKVNPIRKPGANGKGIILKIIKTISEIPEVDKNSVALSIKMNAIDIIKPLENAIIK